jgi:hypothetical protein
MIANDANAQRNEDDSQSDKNMPDNAEKKRSPGKQRLPEMLVYHFILRISPDTKPNVEQNQIQSQSVKT